MAVPITYLAAPATEPAVTLGSLVSVEGGRVPPRPQGAGRQAAVTKPNTQDRCLELSHSAQ